MLSGIVSKLRVKGSWCINILAEHNIPQALPFSLAAGKGELIDCGNPSI